MKPFARHGNLKQESAYSKLLFGQDGNVVKFIWGLVCIDYCDYFDYEILSDFTSYIKSYPA